MTDSWWSNGDGSSWLWDSYMNGQTSGGSGAGVEDYGYQQSYDEKWNEGYSNASLRTDSYAVVEVDDWSTEETGDDFQSFQVSHDFGETYGTYDLPHGARMTPKIPPAFDGQVSWFVFEEMVQDWEDSCQLDKEKRGPALKNRLAGDAIPYKPLLDRDKLKEPESGVEYFLNTLRPNFVKAKIHVYLWRLRQWMKLERGSLDLHRWIAKFNLMRKRLFDSWMDLAQLTTLNTPQYTAILAEIAGEYGARGTPLPTVDEQLLALVNERIKSVHKGQFPFQDSVYAQLFFLQSTLTESQRTLIIQHTKLRGIDIMGWTFELLRELFLELIAAPQSAIDDPNIRQKKFGRTFIVLEEVEDEEGNSGFWCEDEQTCLVGFS